MACSAVCGETKGKTVCDQFGHAGPNSDSCKAVMLERRELRWHTCGRKRITPFDVLVVGAFVSAWLTAVEELKVIEATTPSW